MIAKRRQQLGLTQANLAEMLGVNRTSVVNWETGKHYPSRHVGALEAVLGISLETEPEEIYTDPDEARIWSWSEHSPATRRAMIGALRDQRRREAG